MGYRAYQKVKKYLKPKDRGIDVGGSVAALIDEQSDLTYVVNMFYLSSAYEPDDVDGPESYIQSCVANAVENDSFYWTIDDINEMRAEINERWPKHEERKEALKMLADVVKRVPKGEGFDFTCL